MNGVIGFLDFVDQQAGQSVERLLDGILLKSRLMTGAEGGTIYVVRRRGARRVLEAASAQNDAIRVRPSTILVPVGSDTIAGHVARTGSTLSIDDVYDLPRRAGYSFDPSFEIEGYRTRSMLCFPLKNYRGKVIGVVQLINRRRTDRKRPVPFGNAFRDLVGPIARVVGSLVERAMMTELIASKNQALRQRNRELARQREMIASLQHETEAAFKLSINMLAKGAEIHDDNTGNHILRVNEYSFHLARLRGLPDAFCEEIRYSAQLHDVGKMSVDAAVLKKRGGLTPDERREMMNHPIYGHRILSGSHRLAMAADIALCHHEKWDGSGYPDGRRGEEIPLAARICTLADVYDALRSPRPYKPGMSHAEAMRIILEGDDRIDPAGHFDPALLAILRENHREMDAIWRSLAS